MKKTYTMRGKRYKLYGVYPTLSKAKSKSFELDNSIVTQIPKTKTTPTAYAVWVG